MESSVRQIAVKCVCVVLSASLASGCTTWRPVRPGNGGTMQESLTRGERLRVVTHEGREVVFFVSDADAQGLVGVTEHGNAHVAVRYEEIATIERRAMSGGGKAAVVLLVTAATAVGVYLVAAVLFLLAGGGGSANPAGAAHAVPERTRR